MRRLLTIEWLKLKSYRPFWILLVLYFVVLGLVCSSVMLYLQFIASKGAKFGEIDPSLIPFYDFSDLWQNVTYLATFFKIFLGFIVVISMTNEYEYKTVRQNIIDGMTKVEFISAKLLVIVLLAVLNTLFILVLGLVLGWVYSPVQGLDVMFDHAGFLGAYFLDVLTFLVFALLVAILVKRTGFAIVLLAFYTLFIEPIGTLLLAETYHREYTLHQYFPIHAINNLIVIPFGKYLFREIQDYVALKDIVVVLIYLGLFTFLNYWILRTKDVK